MTDFILTGKAYSDSLHSSAERQNVMLILTALQKIASSSVAAIKKALNNRLIGLKKNIKSSQKTNRIIEQYKNSLNTEDDSSLMDIEENISDLPIFLMEDEIVYLEELIEHAECVKAETKIKKILDLVDFHFKDQSVLFFTEYKTTQALLFAELENKYGSNTVTFINGDEKLSNIKQKNGSEKSISITREIASEKFNSGEVRFLISTEAGGEGIDLQQNCSSLIHVDLPWNPMRLHQRVGRLNRYGQKKTVTVINIRNVETVESKIWDILNAKIESIMNAFGNVMEEPEDLLQLILGMTEGSFFTKVFFEGQTQPKDSLQKWFDQNSKTFGGKDAINAVKNIVGNSLRFDFGELENIPNKNLKDIQPFFEFILYYNGRKLMKNAETYSFITPEIWITEPGIRKRYEDIVFQRSSDRKKNIIGVGHKAIDKAIEQALSWNSTFALVEGLEDPIIIYKISDKVTQQSGNIHSIIIGIKYKNFKDPIILKDDSLLDILNKLVAQNKQFSKDVKLPKLESISQIYLRSQEDVKQVDLSELPFKVPDRRMLFLLLPECCPFPLPIP